MNQEERIPYLKALLFIALADDKVDESEMAYFRRVGDLYGLSESELDDIRISVVEKKESIETIVKGITQRQTKLSLVYELLALCYADNNYSLAERSGLQDVCRLLDIEDEKLKALEEVMDENVALQKKINKVLERGDN